MKRNHKAENAVAACCMALGLLALHACSNSSQPGLSGEPAKQTVSSSAPDSLPPSDSAGERRVWYVAGLSLAVPATARVAYPQGIDSNVLHISGDGFELSADDYGGYGGGGDRTVAGRRAKLTERDAPGCRELVWEIELPVANRLDSICPPGATGNQCTHPPGHAVVAARCASNDACAKVRSIIDSAQFAPQPWPALPARDQQWQPPTRVCKPGAG